MPVSFTFGSVGDIISVGLVICDLVETLDSSRGSSAEYQALIRELWSLDYALLETALRARSCETSPELNALAHTAKDIAQRCSSTITAFRDRIKGYQNCLAEGSSTSVANGVASKLKWRLTEKKHLARLRTEVKAHCASLNLLLSTMGVTVAQGNESRLAQIDARTKTNAELIRRMDTNLAALTSVLDIDYLRRLGCKMLGLVRKIWKVNLLTYRAVLSLQERIPSTLGGHWAQEPVTLEDAHGRHLPIPLELINSWEMKAFESILEVRFRNLPGHQKVKKQEYMLRSAKSDREIIRDRAFERWFLPGHLVRMSMIFFGRDVDMVACPGCPYRVAAPPQAEYVCPRCALVYQQVLQERLVDRNDQTAAQVTGDSLEDNHNSETAINKDEVAELPSDFKRVSIHCFQRDQPTDPNYCNQEHKAPKADRGKKFGEADERANDIRPRGGLLAALDAPADPSAVEHTLDEVAEDLPESSGEDGFLDEPVLQAKIEQWLPGGGWEGFRPPRNAVTFKCKECNEQPVMQIRTTSHCHMCGHQFSPYSVYYDRQRRKIRT